MSGRGRKLRRSRGRIDLDQKYNNKYDNIKNGVISLKKTLLPAIVLLVMVVTVLIGSIRTQAADDYILVNAHSGDGAGTITFTLNAYSGGSIGVKYVAYAGGSSGTEKTVEQIYSAAGTDTVAAGSSSTFHLNKMYDAGGTYPNGYVLFFVKPSDNHLLLSATAETGTQFYDYYPVDTLINNAGSTTLSGYPHVAELSQRAKNEGYVMAFGYSRLHAEDGNAAVTVRSEQPTLTVNVETDNTSTVQVGDTFNVIARITPEQISLGSGESLSVTLTKANLSITVDGEQISNFTLSGPNSDGTYTATFSHTMTQDEWNAGQMSINVNATSTYRYSFQAHMGSTDTGSVTTRSTVSNSASVNGSWNTNQTYTLKYDANGGDGAPADQTQESFRSATFAVSNTIPTRTGYVFLGWADSAADTTPRYSRGSTVTVSNSDTNRTKTIYAVWITQEQADQNKKQGVPWPEKKVWYDNQWRDTAFAGVNKVSTEADITFKITGTMPTNLKEKKKDSEGQPTEEYVYSSYTDYKFTDTYDEGITPDISSIRVYLYAGDENTEQPAVGLTTKTVGVDAVDITSLFDIDTGTSGTITVNLKKSNVEAADGTSGIVDLKKSYTIGETTVSFNKNSKIVVYYTAKLNANAAKGATGNTNKAHLEFRNAEGEYLYTPDDVVKVFTFGIDLTKYKDSAAAGNELSGASFKLYKDQKDEDHLVGSGTSAANGKVTFTDVTSIAAGTYILEETNSPAAGYNRMTDLTIVIVPTVVDPSATPELTAVRVISYSEDDGTFTVDSGLSIIHGSIINHAGSILPSTGGPGTTVLYLLGIALIATAGAGIVMKRRKTA